jgi:PAS domain S-box-containing protein
MLPLSDSLVASILSIAADAIICVDGEQRITFFNEGASRIFGYEADEMMGQPLAILLPLRFRAGHSGHIAAFGHSAVPARRMGERSLISGVRKNGEEFPAEAAIAHMQSDRGPVFSVVLRDVTEQRRAREMNDQLLVEMEKAVKQRDEMLGLVSHDLRNPVNAVKMLAGAILRLETEGLTLRPEVVEHATVMLQAANQMDRLIQDLLDSTRLEAGRLRLAPRWCSIAELVTLTLDTLKPMAASKSIALVVDMPETLPDVFADTDRLAQVMSNLVGNAMKFTPAGGSVSVKGALDGKFVLIQVRDSGIGIAVEDLPFVFDRFWQSRRTNRSGAGLGLAIARGIVLGHGGRIWIESTPGTGTLVSFTLPTREPAARDS